MTTAVRFVCERLSLAVVAIGTIVMILVFIIVQDNATHIGYYPVVFERNDNVVETEGSRLRHAADGRPRGSRRTHAAAAVRAAARRAGAVADGRNGLARRPPVLDAADRELDRPFAARHDHARRRPAAVLLPLAGAGQRPVPDAAAHDHAGLLSLHDADAREGESDGARPRALADQPHQRSGHPGRLSARAADDLDLRAAALRPPQQDVSRLLLQRGGPVDARLRGVGESDRLDRLPALRTARAGHALHEPLRRAAVVRRAGRACVHRVGRHGAGTRPRHVGRRRHRALADPRPHVGDRQRREHADRQHVHAAARRTALDRRARAVVRADGLGLRRLRLPVATRGGFPFRDRARGDLRRGDGGHAALSSACSSGGPRNCSRPRVPRST